MAISIQGYTPEQVPLVREFNQRLVAGGAPPELCFPETPVSADLPEAPGRSICEQYFLATDGGQVRGGFILKHWDFSWSGQVRPIAHFRLPVSEGLVDRRYSGVALRLLQHALRRQPLLFALGMGSLERPLPQMLRAAGWNLWTVPFYFKVLHAPAFLRHIQPLRRTAARRLLLDAAAASGAGWMGLQAWRLLREHARPDPAVKAEIVPEFCAWTDPLWEQCKSHYLLSAVRDRRALQLLYPAGDDRWLRVKVTRRNEVLGWVLMLDTRMEKNKYFGDMRVGSIADCLALPADATPVLLAACELLERRGVDILISNQAHGAWCSALQATGFLTGPSNFIFAASKPLSAVLPPALADFHINRGDGDGPIHL